MLGAIGYQSNIDTTTLLAPNTTATKKFLRMTGTGANGAIPAWDTVVAGDISGTLAVANGGTGAATQSAAANAILPAQTSNSGKVLTTDGTNASWGTAAGSNVKSYTRTGLASNGTSYELGSSAMLNSGTVAQIFFGSETTSGFPATSITVMRLTVGGSPYYQITGLNGTTTVASTAGGTWSPTFGYAFYVMVDAAGKLQVKCSDTRWTYTATAIVYGP
jgi:hypothetical protein